MGYKPIAKDCAWEVTVITAPTCGKDGKGNRTCTICGKVEKNIKLEATGEHNYQFTDIDATCDAPAKVGLVCTVCGGTKDLEVVEGSKSLGHKYVESYVEPSCTKGNGILFGR